MLSPYSIPESFAHCLSADLGSTPNSIIWIDSLRISSQLLDDGDLSFEEDVAILIFMVLLVSLALLAQLQLPYEQLLNNQDKFYLFFIFFAFSSIRVTYGNKNNDFKP